MAVGEFLSAVQGSFATPAAAGRQEVTCGFEPGLVFLWTVGHPTAVAAPSQRTARWGFGVASADRQQRAVANLLQHGEVPPGTHAAAATRTDRCMVMGLDQTVLGAVTVTGEAEFLWATATGFVLEWLSAPSGGPYRMHYLAVGGPDLGRVAVGTLTAPTAGVLPVVQRASVGFRPRCVICFGAHRAADVVTEPGATFCLGASDHTDLTGAPLGRNRASAVIDNDASPVDVASYHVTNRVYVGLHPTTGAVDGEAAHEVSDADGFELWWFALPTIAARLFYVAIEGGQWRAGHLTTRTTPGAASLTGMFWQGDLPPEAVLFWSGAAPASAVHDPATGRWSFGAASAPGGGASTQHESIDAAAASTIYAGNDDGVPLKLASAAVVTAAAEVANFAADAINLDYTVASSPGLRAMFLAVGPKTRRGILAGVTRDATGAVLPGAQVDAFRLSDNVHVGRTTSGADGAYSLSVYGASQDRYYVRAFLAGSPNRFGTTDEALVAA